MFAFLFASSPTEFSSVVKEKRCKMTSSFSAGLIGIYLSFITGERMSPQSSTACTTTAYPCLVSPVISLHKAIDIPGIEKVKVRDNESLILFSNAFLSSSHSKCSPLLVLLQRAKLTRQPRALDFKFLDFSSSANVSKILTECPRTGK